MTTKQHTLDEYADARSYGNAVLNTIVNLLWDAGAMTKDVHERLQALIKNQEDVHEAVLNIYEAYTEQLRCNNTLVTKENNDDN